MEVNTMQELYVWATTALRSFRDREEGQGLVEYALILVLVSIASIVVLGALGADISSVFETISDGLTG